MACRLACSWEVRVLSETCSLSPSNMIQRAAKRLMNRRWTQREAAVGILENRCTIPSSFGTNCTASRPPTFAKGRL